MKDKYRIKKDFKYFIHYLLYLFLWPIYLVELIVFFECPDRGWDSDLWFYRMMVWHDCFITWEEIK